MDDTATIDRPTTTEVVEHRTNTPAGEIALKDLDLQVIALSHFDASREALESARKTLTGVVHDLSTAGKLADAKSLRNRLVNIPLADARKVSKNLKSKLTAVSAAVGVTLVEIESDFETVEKLITPQIEARDAEIAAKKAEDDRIAAERKAKFEGEIAKIRACADRCAGLPAWRIANGIKLVEDMAFGDDWLEFAKPAAVAQAETLTAMRTLHARTVEAERQAAEAEARRVEQERIAAEQRAEAARLQAQQAELARQQAELDRQREAIAAEARRVEEAAAQGRRDADAKAQADAQARADADAKALTDAQSQVLREVPAKTDPGIDVLFDPTFPTHSLAPAPSMEEVTARAWAIPGATAQPNGGEPDIPPLAAGAVEPTTDLSNERIQELNGGKPVATFSPIAFVEPPAPAADAPPISIGTINDRLAVVTVTGANLIALGFNPVESKGRSMLFAAADWPLIKAALLAHIEGLQ